MAKEVLHGKRYGRVAICRMISIARFQKDYSFLTCYIDIWIVETETIPTVVVRENEIGSMMSAAINFTKLLLNICLLHGMIDRANVTIISQMMEARYFDVSNAVLL
jgi:hypothetical protein